ncbi:MAG TPA: hypothetical protein VJ583_11615 [Nitrososphaeraceae archaeon]|nr:hypothetical protein [Nitrososphaeraceae archaeon]
MQKENRTFKEWWNNLPDALRKESMRIVEYDNIDDSSKLIKKINYILLQLDLMKEENNNNNNKPTFEELKQWFNTGQLFIK